MFYKKVESCYATKNLDKSYQKWNIIPSHPTKLHSFLPCIHTHTFNTHTCTHFHIHSWWCYQHFPRYWPFVASNAVNSMHKGQWRRALMFSLICAWINGWVNKGEAGVLRCHHAHHDVTVMFTLAAITGPPTVVFRLFTNLVTSHCNSFEDRLTVDFTHSYLWPLLLTWFNLNPSMN